MAVIGRELYDYEKDPMETTNVADDPDYEDVLDMMNQRLRAWFAEQAK